MDTSTAAVTARSRELTVDQRGRSVWQVRETPVQLESGRTALLLCDVWNTHWCPSATERMEALLPDMNRVVRDLRARGFLIVHAPSETMEFYRDHPGRSRALEAPPAEAPAIEDKPEPPLPVATDYAYGCDTPGSVAHSPWTRQHPAIEIDADRDVISDDGRELYNVYRARGITSVAIMGVHTNMCVLNRSFAIKAMVRSGLRPLLVRDLTDAMYDPADPPYVSHEEGTGLVIEYIEKFWCPSVSSSMLLQPDAG